MAFFNGIHLFYELFALFASSFVSATLFPGGSELLLIYFVQSDPDNLWFYFATAALGNSLGALLTYFMGYYLNWGREKTQSKHQKAWLFCQRYGTPTLLLSWLPIIGDLLPLVAGWLRLAILPASLLIITGKTLRYWLVVSSTLSLL